MRHGTRMQGWGVVLVLALAAPARAEPVAGEAPEGAQAAGGEVAPEAEPQAASPVRRQAAHARARSSDEERVQRLTRGLKLDPEQQAKVRLALRAQREELRRLMAAPADPEVQRVAAIHAITTRTAERIRAVLHDDQRKLFSQPMPQALEGEPKPDVERWLKVLRTRGN